MLQENTIKLTIIEEEIAKKALQNAYNRETNALIASVRDRASSITELKDLWYLHDLLSTKRHEIDGKYVYNSSTIVFDFARLVKEKWLTIEELQGLKSEMLSKISVLSKM